MSYLDPRLPSRFYKSYRILAPAPTHFRPATCAEVDCPPYLHGWRTRVEGLPPELVHTARTSGRRYTEMHVAEGETWLIFEAGQPCFKASEHRVRIDRPEIYIVADGDRRASMNHRRHANAADWVEDFGENQQRLADQAERG